MSVLPSTRLWRTGISPWSPGRSVRFTGNDENVSEKMDKDDLRENGQREGVKSIVGAYLKIFRKFSILRSYRIHVRIAFWTKVLNFKTNWPTEIAVHCGLNHFNKR